MKTYIANQISQTELNELTARPAIDFEGVMNIAKDIVSNVKARGDDYIKELTAKFDGADLDSLLVTEEEFKEAEEVLSDKVKQAIETAYQNIFSFHSIQTPGEQKLETTPGIECFRQARAIERVGLYVPGGTATLPSTVLMLAVPAQIARCEKIVITTPPASTGKVAPEILYAAKVCGVKTVVKVGGAQAVAALAYGTETVPKVDKIFGPGNQFVTAAKMIVSQDESMTAIDMPAGPSEVLVIANDTANPAFVASDLLSQAEHGADSQAVGVVLSQEFADKVSAEVEKQLEQLPRKDMAMKALEGSLLLVVENLKEAMDFSNNYAPEHLIIHTETPRDLIPQIKNAGSVFLGAYTPESLGDYASGTNHSLPTYGYAKMYSGVSVDSFLKKITFQEASFEGLKNIGETVMTLAEAESLEAHRRAVEIRLEN